MACFLLRFYYFYSPRPPRPRPASPPRPPPTTRLCGSFTRKHRAPPSTPTLNIRNIRRWPW
eukprot:2936470-Pyramimonas_sp.AAC.1